MPTAANPFMFQFQLGSIKSAGELQPTAQETSFNSSLVRLRVEGHGLGSYRRAGFQFQLGSIKRRQYVFEARRLKCFNSSLVRLRESRPMESNHR